MTVPPATLPGGLSSDSYVERSLRHLDAEHYSAAGLLLYRRTDEGVELLLVREKPWNSFTQAYDPVALNVLGGKRVPRQERSMETTAVRCFLESVGQVEGSPDTEGLYSMLSSSFMLWYALGKFALIITEVPNDTLADLPANFMASKEQAGPHEEFKMLPTGVKKYIKQIEALEWVPASTLVPEQQSEVTDLLSNVLQIGGFRDFLEGNMDPASLPEREEPELQDKGKDAGKAKGKGKQEYGGKPDFGKGKGKGRGAGKDGGKGGWGKGGGWGK
eukprot:CAMPEP_0197895102 /NCGR_PEP_ID=MMETSP1439-20131203/36520_1 /TAXON_ID=66791 /ORGANISM="Gonyaulax spinifera, Strain CCMP409" /LENGTH=273 /DNA_ID=CAMNT_0043515513 /DNA_START=7 /DNA_END=825 /DNA_ORIENTATION=+